MYCSHALPVLYIKIYQLKSAERVVSVCWLFKVEMHFGDARVVETLTPGGRLTLPPASSHPSTPSIFPTDASYKGRPSLWHETNVGVVVIPAVEWDASKHRYVRTHRFAQPPINRARHAFASMARTRTYATWGKSR